MLIHREKFEKASATKKVKNENLFEPEAPWPWQSSDNESEVHVEVKVELDTSLIEQVMVKQEQESDDGSFSMPFSPEPDVEVRVKHDPDEVKKKTFLPPPPKLEAGEGIIVKMLKCKQCDELFDDEKSFGLHFRIHQKAKKESQTDTTCKFCHKTFAKFQFLKLHIAAIHEKNLFECEICGKKFSFERAKIRHVEVIHNNQRNYVCKSCEKSFGTSTQLKQHVNYYHNSKPLDRKSHYCELCEKYFAQAKNLRQHILSVHEGIKQKAPKDFRCKLCKEIFSNKYQKEKHHAQVHLNGKKLTRSCRLCDLEFQLFDDFKKHIEDHKLPFMCLICGSNSPCEEAFMEHKANHRQVDMYLRQHICDVCGHRCFKRLQMQIHMRKHMENANAYVCDICGAGYKYIAPFLYHKKAHAGKRDFVSF